MPSSRRRQRKPVKTLPKDHDVSAQDSGAVEGRAAVRQLRASDVTDALLKAMELRFSQECIVHHDLVETTLPIPPFLHDTSIDVAAWLLGTFGNLCTTINGKPWALAEVIWECVKPGGIYFDLRNVVSTRNFRSVPPILHHIRTFIEPRDENLLRDISRCDLCKARTNYEEEGDVIKMYHLLKCMCCSVVICQHCQSHTDLERCSTCFSFLCSECHSTQTAKTVHEFLMSPLRSCVCGSQSTRCCTRCTSATNAKPKSFWEMGNPYLLVLSIPQSFIVSGKYPETVEDMSTACIECVKVEDSLLLSAYAAAWHVKRLNEVLPPGIIEETVFSNFWPSTAKLFLNEILALDLGCDARSKQLRMWGSNFWNIHELQSNSSYFCEECGGSVALDLLEHPLVCTGVCNRKLCRNCYRVPSFCPQELHGCCKDCISLVQIECLTCEEAGCINCTNVYESCAWCDTLYDVDQESYKSELLQKRRKQIANHIRGRDSALDGSEDGYAGLSKEELAEKVAQELLNELEESTSVKPKKPKKKKKKKKKKSAQKPAVEEEVSQSNASSNALVESTAPNPDDGEESSAAVEEDDKSLRDSAIEKQDGESVVDLYHEPHINLVSSGETVNEGTDSEDSSEDEIRWLQQNQQNKYMSKEAERVMNHKTVRSAVQLASAINELDLHELPIQVHDQNTRLLNDAIGMLHGVSGIVAVRRKLKGCLRKVEKVKDELIQIQSDMEFARQLAEEERIREEEAKTANARRNLQPSTRGAQDDVSAHSKNVPGGNVPAAEHGVKKETVQTKKKKKQPKQKEESDRRNKLPPAVAQNQDNGSKVGSGNSHASRLVDSRNVEKAKLPIPKNPNIRKGASGGIPLGLHGSGATVVPENVEHLLGRLQSNFSAAASPSVPAVNTLMSGFADHTLNKTSVPKQKAGSSNRHQPQHRANLNHQGSFAHGLSHPTRSLQPSIPKTPFVNAQVQPKGDVNAWSRNRSSAVQPGQGNQATSKPAKSSGHSVAMSQTHPNSRTNPLVNHGVGQTPRANGVALQSFPPALVSALNQRRSRFSALQLNHFQELQQVVNAVVAAEVVHIASAAGCLDRSTAIAGALVRTVGSAKSASPVSLCTMLPKTLYAKLHTELGRGKLKHTTIEQVFRQIELLRSTK